MTATASPAPWAASDEAARKLDRRRAAADQWNHIGHLRPSQLKNLLLTKVIPAEAQLRSIDMTIGNYVAAIAAADSHHNEVTARLQAELDDPKTKTERRIECGAALHAHNAELRVEADRLNALIAAAKDDREVYSAIAVGRGMIEDAYIKNARTPAENLREAVLRKVIQSLDRAIDAVNQRDDEGAGLACAELRKYRYMATSEMDEVPRRYRAELYA